MSVLCLDLARVTGWAVLLPPYRRPPTPLEFAVGAPAAQPKSGSFEFSLMYGDEGIGGGLVQYEKWLLQKITAYTVLRIVHERAFLPKFQSSNSSAIVAWSMLAITYKVAAQLQIAMEQVANNTLKLHATGSGKTPKGQSKAVMREAAAERGWIWADHNEVDALWIADWWLTKTTEVTA